MKKPHFVSKMMFFKAFSGFSARNLTNGGANGSKTLLQSPRQLPEAQGRNRTAICIWTNALAIFRGGFDAFRKTQNY